MLPSFGRLFVPIVLIAICVATGWMSARDSEAGALLTFVVDTTSDNPLLDQCTVSAGDCSWRGAMFRAHSNPDATLIQFRIPPGGVQTINVTAQSADLSTDVQIDGTTQQEVLPSGSCTVQQGGPPCIILNGSGGALTDDGIVAQTGSRVRIKGLAIVGFVNGIWVAGGSNHEITGNYIGTANGTSGSANQQAITVDAAAGSVQIGGTSVTDRNVISGNGFGGVFLHSTGAVVEGNYIGINKDGNAALGNGLSHPSIESASGNFIGSTQPGGGNLISGGGGTGITLTGNDNHVEGNLIGTDKDGTAAVPNLGEGVLSLGAANFIGSALPGGRNVVSGNMATGIRLEGNSNHVLGNYVGTDVTGAQELPNNMGIFVTNASLNVIGSASAGGRNVISGNATSGIVLVGASQTTVEGNYVGTNAAGNAPVPNHPLGALWPGAVVIDASPETMLGGPTAASRNVISGNQGVGVRLTGQPGTTGSTIMGNYIGVSANGSDTLGNMHEGITLVPTKPANPVQGNTISGNVISGNGSNIAPGIHINAALFTGASVKNNEIYGNTIGLNPGRSVAAHNYQGIYVHGENGGTATGNSIGKPGAAANVISGNTDAGVVFLGGGVTHNTITNNIIGTNANGASGLGNGGHGVLILASTFNMIGGAPGNVIMSNGGAGVVIDGQVAAATGNRITQNSIDNNSGLGIDLIGQANGNAPAPVLTSATAGSTHITGTLSTIYTETSFIIEFFRSPSCDAGGFGEGRTYLGVTTVETDTGGSATIDVTLPANTPGGQAVTATATLGADDTSEFSNCVTMVGPTPSPSPTASPTPTPTPTPSPTPVDHPTPTPTGGANLRGDGNCDGFITLDDVMAALSEYAGVDPGAPCAENANVDCVAGVTPFDAILILDYVAQVPVPNGTECPPPGV